MIAKFRVISHNLQIEIGRRNNTAREHRVCHCQQIEDEEHFILHCESYIDIRLQFIIQGQLSLETILNDKQYVPYIVELYKRRTQIRNY